MVGPQAYHDTLPSSLGRKGTGAPGASELWTVMDAIEKVRRNRGLVEVDLNEEEWKIAPARNLKMERIQPEPVQRVW